MVDELKGIQTSQEALVFSLDVFRSRREDEKDNYSDLSLWKVKWVSFT